MRRILSCILISAVLLAMSFPTAHAQSFSSFILSGKAGTLAMGDVSFLSPDLATHRMDASVSFGKWTPQTLNYSALQAGVFLALNDNFGLRLDYRNNLFSEMELIDANGNVTGTAKPGEQRIRAGVSLRLAETFYLDVDGKYLMADMAGKKASAFAGDLGFSYHKDAFTLGLKGADLGSKYSFGSSPWSLPMRVLAGGSYDLAPAEGHALTLAADLGYIIPTEYSCFTASAGLRYAFKDMVYARAGYHFSSAVAPRFASFGLGIAFKGIGLDAAYLLGAADNAWTVTLRVAL